MEFTDKGDTYHGNRRITCAACGTTSETPSALSDHSCPCGRVLNGPGRRDEPDLG